MTILALGLVAALAVACVIAVALPFLREPEPRHDRLDELDALEVRRLELVEERDRALDDLRELEFDHRTGKIADPDYNELVGPLRGRAAATLQALEPRAGRDMIASVRAEQQEPARVPEPFPPPDEGDPPQPATVPEPFPPPDEGDRPQPPHIPEPTPTPMPEPGPGPIQPEN